MSDYSANTKRIAKNTLVLYGRMFLLMLISLFTSRVTLQALGVEDFGVYNVVSGFVLMLAFFTSSLSNASQRFISIGLGKNNLDDTSRAFRQSNTILIILSILVVVVAETIGLWFVTHKLVIPENRMHAALWAYQMSIIMTVCSIIQVTFLSAIISHERMGIYAYLAVFEAFAKLAICFILLRTNSDHLILYSILFAVVSIITLLFYIIYSLLFFEEFSLKLIWNKPLLADMSKFIGTNVYGCLAYAGGIQGTNIILNMFFGPAVNAARGISTQVSSVAIRFTDSVMTAVKPQIIKSYSSGDISYLMMLINKSTKFTFFIGSIITVPVIFECEFLLQLWLGNVPDYAVSFTKLALIETLISSLANPLWLAANATGNIKNNQIYGRTITLLSLPLSYIALKVCNNPNIVMWIIAIMAALYWIYCLYDIKRQLGIDAGGYFYKSIIPGVALNCSMIMIGLVLTACFDLRPIIMFLVRGGTVVISGLIMSFVLMEQSERSMILNFARIFQKIV